LELIPTLTGPFDLVFIDASKREYTDYYEAVLPKLVDRGLIVADNMLWGGDALNPDATDPDTVGIRAFVDHVHADPRVRNTLLPVGDGLLLVWKTASRA